MFHVNHPGQMRMRIILNTHAKKYPHTAGKFLAQFVLAQEGLDKEIERSPPNYDISDDAIRQIYRSKYFYHFVIPPWMCGSLPAVGFTIRQGWALTTP